MAKATGQIVKKLPSNEEIGGCFGQQDGSTYFITSKPDHSIFYLYKKVEGGYEYLKQRKNNPYFDEWKGN